jgi:cytochrome c-type biogenesis protein CcmH/NrfG
MAELHTPSLIAGLLAGAFAVFFASVFLWKQLRGLRQSALVEEAGRAELLEKQLRELEKENAELKTENRKANRKLKKVTAVAPRGKR